MARSSFRLPAIQELNKQQQNALDLPLEGQHLVVGGPGTGKSVVALLRAGQLAREEKNYLFLVYNVLLEKNSYALGGGELRAVTWKKWFKDAFPEWFGRDMPTYIKKNDKNGKKDVSENWDAIVTLAPVENIDNSLYLVIDEGQDMPPQFYRTLVNIGFENFYVVADQNQRITEHNSSRKKIEKSLGLQTTATLELTSNYRNSLPIARLAKEFFTNDPASASIELPKPNGGEKIPKMLRYDGNVDGIATQILRAYDRNTNKLICVITPNDNIRRKFCTSLEGAVQSGSLDHNMPEIQTYSAAEKITNHNLIGLTAKEKCPRCGAEMKTKKNNTDGSVFWGCANYFTKKCTYTKPYVHIDFREGGIVVINQQSIKGLEFDTVCIADIDDYWRPGITKDDLMKKFYVMVSRARDIIVLLHVGDNIRKEVAAIIPNNETILERR